MKYILAIAMLISLIGLTSCSRATNDTNSTSTNSTILSMKFSAFTDLASVEKSELAHIHNLTKKIDKITNDIQSLSTPKLTKQVKLMKSYILRFSIAFIVLILFMILLGYYFFRLLTKKIYENKEYATSMTTVFSVTLANMITNQEKTNEAIKQNQNDFQNSIISNQNDFQNKILNFINNFMKKDIEKDKKIQDLIQIIANQNAEKERQNQLIEKIKNEKARLKTKYGENQ